MIPTAAGSASSNIVASTDTVAINRGIEAICRAFRSTHLCIAFITEIDNTPPPYPSPSVDHARLVAHFSPGILPAVQEHGAVMVEAGDFSAVAIWEPPNFAGVPFPEKMRNGRPLREEWANACKAAKEKYLGTKVRISTESDGSQTTQTQINPFYHLWILGRDPDTPAAPGAISAVVKPFLRRAKEEGFAVWLEATTKYAMAIYEHYGFVVVEELTIGKGRRDKDGWPQTGGPGVTAWAMIYNAQENLNV